MRFLQRKFTIIKNSNCPTVLIQVNRHQRCVRLLDPSELLISKKAKWHIQNDNTCNNT